MEGFNFKHPLQLRFSDFDMLGHLNNAHYATLMELGRLEYFMNLKWDLNETSNVVASFKIDYLIEVKPLVEVEVWIRTVSLGHKSFKMEYVLTSTTGNTIYAKAESFQVCINKIDKSSTPIPEEIRAILTAFEKL